MKFLKVDLVKIVSKSIQFFKYDLIIKRDQKINPAAIPVFVITSIVSDESSEI